MYHIYDKPRDRIKHALFGRVKTFHKPFWALRDVTFEVQAGEAVGIVGRNGSGKSTLLQIIAGTLTPTEGEVVVRGRVAALLELGSGFNPEFTGRENVFLQGSILGISRREMEDRFDGVASFADIGEFIEQPVKHYSSGMHARLAFSVAVSVNPDILIVDEVLAVGDMAFQTKCVARMRQLLDSGVTLLYVSHAPDAVKSLCRKALYLSTGKQTAFGSSVDVVERYIADTRIVANSVATRTQLESPPVANSAMRYGSGQARIENVRLLDGEGAEVSAYKFGETITLEATVRAQAELDRLDLTFGVRDAAGVDLVGSGTTLERVVVPTLRPGQSATVRFRFNNALRQGNYGVFITLTRLPAAAGEFGVTVDHLAAAQHFASLSDGQTVVMHKFYLPVLAEIVPTPSEILASARVE